MTNGRSVQIPAFVFMHFLLFSVISGFSIDYFQQMVYYVTISHWYNRMELYS